MSKGRPIAFSAAVVLAVSASVIAAARNASSLRAGVLTNVKASGEAPHLFPPSRNLVTAGDIRGAGVGTPEGGLLEWTRAVQQRDVRTVERLTSSRARVARTAVAAAVQTVGSLFAYPRVISQRVAGTTASLSVDLLSYSPNRSKPALSLPANYVMDRERGQWRVRSTAILLRNAADLNRVEHASG